MTEQTIRQNYRITSWRFDITESTYSTPSFNGTSVEDCDEQAKAHFCSVSNLPANEWNGMRIVRIDSPAVAEKTTQLERNGRQEGSND